MKRRKNQILKKKMKETAIALKLVTFIKYQQLLVIIKGCFWFKIKFITEYLNAIHTIITTR